MKLKRGQGTAEFVIVIIFFIILISILFTKMFDIAPSEVSKIKEQRACSQAESVTDYLLRHMGNTTAWEGSKISDINELGLSNGRPLEINYTKWQNASTHKFNELVLPNTTNMSVPFYINYEGYTGIITSSISDYDIIPLPNQSTPRAHIKRTSNDVTILAGANTLGANLSLKLFFPSGILALAKCGNGQDSEGGDSNTSVLKDNGSEVIINWQFGSNDVDCVIVSIPAVAAGQSEIMYISDIYFKNETSGQSYNLYLGNLTNLGQPGLMLNDEFGSTGVRFDDKSYCEVERAGAMKYEGPYGEIVPAYFKVVSWA